MKQILILILLLTAATSFGEPFPAGTTEFKTGQQPLNATTAVQVAPKGNSRQRAVIIRNHDETISIYIVNPGGTATTGLLIKAGESITLNTTSAVFAIAASGTPTAGYLTEND